MCKYEKIFIVDIVRLQSPPAHSQDSWWHGGEKKSEILNAFPEKYHFLLFLNLNFK